MTVKVAVIYYSATGGVHALADKAAEVARAAGADVRLRRASELAPDTAIDSNPAWRAHADGTASQVEIATPDDFEWADVVLLGSPTRYGNIAAQLKQLLDTLGGLWQQGKLADKVYAGFTASATLHGGQESTLLALYNTIHHFGGIIVSPGYTDPSKFVDGNPYGVGFVSGQGGQPGETEFTAIAHEVQRALRIAEQLKRGADAASADAANEDEHEDEDEKVPAGV